MPYSSWLVLVSAVLLLACDSPTVEPVRVPDRLVLTGNDQSAVAGQALAEPIVVRVVDEDGSPVARQLVNFRVTAGGGSVFAGVAETNAAGEAREIWTLGTSVADSQRVEARVVDPATGAPLVLGSFRATVLPDMPSAIEADDATGSGNANQPLPDSVRLIVRDEFANPVPGVPVTWTVLVGNGTVSPAVTTTAADGSARVQWTLGGGTGTQQLQARVDSLLAHTFVAMSIAAPSPPANLDISPDSVVLFVPTQRVTLQTVVTDAFGNVLDVPHTWLSLDTMVATVSSSGEVAGVHTGSTHIVAAAQNVADTVGVRIAFDSQGTELIAQTLSVGEQRACAVAADGTGYCWGEDAALAREVGDLRFASLIVGGSALRPYPQMFNTCGLDLQGFAHCWSDSPHNSPRVDIGGQTFTRMDVGGGFACGIGTDAHVYCWGSGGSGALGQADTASSASPVRVRIPGDPQVARVTAGVEHACALSTDGMVYCWGSNPGGALGVSSGACEYFYIGRSPCAPMAAVQAGTGDLTFTSISAGLAVTCGTATDGYAYCWGSNRWRQLGDPALGSSASSQPIRVSYEGIAQVDTGEGHVCSLTTADLAVCWGFNPYGAYPVGAGSTESFVSAPTRAYSTLTHDAIHSGWILTCATGPAGAVHCWGAGYLGDGQRHTTRSPVRVLREVSGP